jgi:DNA polymerase III subunit delta
VVQIKPADTDRFLARPDPSIRLVLIYGADEGLVTERAAAFATAVVGDANDPFALVRIDAATLADDPKRLADEAHAVPLFGGRRAILLRLSGNRSIQPAVEAILAAPPVDSWVVIAAGELRKTAPLRRLCETAKGAAAIACYTDSDRDLDRLIDQETSAAGLSVTPEARAALKALIGGDRLASRSELAKLCLYAAGQETIEVDDIRAVIGDASAFAIDEAIDAVALGDPQAFDRGYRRLLASGTPGSVVAGAALRHFNFLQKARAAVDGGTSPDNIVARASPPFFFRRRADVARQISMWSAPRIERALIRLDQSMIDSRLNRQIADEVVGQTLQMVAAVAASARR